MVLEVDAPPNQNFGHDLIAGLARPGAHEPLGIVGMAQRDVEAADGLEGLALDQESPLLVADVLAIDVPMSCALDGQLRRDEVLDVGDAEAQSGPRLEPLHLPRQLLRMPEVVGVQERQEGTGRGFDARVAGGRLTPIRLPYDQHGLRASLGDTRRVVSGPVVDDDHLEVLVALGEDALEGLGEVPLAVVDGYDAAHEGVAPLHFAASLIESSEATLTFSMPMFERLQLESQANCNRSCWFCPRTYDRSGRYLDSLGRAVLARMPTQTILDVLDQARAMGFRGRVGFHHYSEPLLDERNPTLAEAALERGMHPYLHTNGDVLRVDDALRDRVVRLYSLIVVGLYDYRSTEELEAEKAYWRRRLPGTNLKFSAISRDGGRATKNMSVPKASVPTDTRMGAPDLLYPNGPCQRPMIRAIIQHDGTMCNCCEDMVGSFQLGSIHESPLAELWSSPRHVEVVENLIAGRRDLYSLCSRCPQSPSGPPPSGQRLQILPRRHRPANGQETAKLHGHP